ncbi:hypothetical protein DXG01_013376 [Tephrocybe rancida]|nr:hypothetical protein DXG01_013376 [Tephrocybe rancida]
MPMLRELKFLEDETTTLIFQNRCHGGDGNSQAHHHVHSFRFPDSTTPLTDTFYSFFCFLQTSHAISLIPPLIPLSFGASFQVTWTTDPGDPGTFNLVTTCTTFGGIAASVTTTPANTADGKATVTPNIPPLGLLGEIIDADGTVLAGAAETITKVNIGDSQSPPPSDTAGMTSQASVTSSTDESPTLSVSSVTTTFESSLQSLSVLPTNTSKVSTASITTEAPSATSFSAVAKATSSTISSTIPILLPLPSSNNPAPTSSTDASSTSTIDSNNANSSAPTSTPDGQSKPIGAIAGGAAGGVAIVAILGVVVLIVWRRRNKASSLGDLEYLRNEELKNSDVDDEWVGPPPGTRSPGPAEFDGPVRSQTPHEAVQGFNHDNYEYPSHVPSPGDYQGAYTAHGYSPTYGYLDPSASSQTSRVDDRRYVGYGTHTPTSSSNSGSTSGLLPGYI